MLERIDRTYNYKQRTKEITTIILIFIVIEDKWNIKIVLDRKIKILKIAKWDQDVCL